jgi:hypothetical protein
MYKGSNERKKKKTNGEGKRSLAGLLALARLERKRDFYVHLQ